MNKEIPHSSTYKPVICEYSPGGFVRDDNVFLRGVRKKRRFVLKMLKYCTFEPNRRFFLPVSRPMRNPYMLKQYLVKDILITFPL